LVPFDPVQCGQVHVAMGTHRDTVDGMVDRQMSTD